MAMWLLQTVDVGVIIDIIIGIIDKKFMALFCYFAIIIRKILNVSATRLKCS